MQKVVILTVNTIYIDLNNNPPFKPVLEKVDFKEAIKPGPPIEFLNYEHVNAGKLLDLLNKFYDENFYSPYQEQPKIPKIIHKFWDNGTPP